VSPDGGAGSASGTTEFARAVQEVRAGASAGSAAQRLLGALTDEEKLGLLDGDEPFWPGMPIMMGEGYNLEPIVAGAVDRLGIPGLRFSDGPRGAVIGSSTAFPVPMARGATWDPELEQRVGDAIGGEVRAQGGTFFGGVCINLLRHPAWGRAQETYGEEPLLLGAMGAALTRGAQRHVMACVKHYACNSMENARFTVDVQVDEQTLHEVYLPHFRAVVDAGVVSVMSAYNSVNGQWCGQNRVLLHDILREEWGSTGSSSRTSSGACETRWPRFAPGWTWKCHSSSSGPEPCLPRSRRVGQPGRTWTGRRCASWRRSWGSPPRWRTPGRDPTSSPHPSTARSPARSPRAPSCSWPTSR
jgi:beta-glucosidase